MQRVKLFTDGACSGNPGPGGWGVVLVCQDPEAVKESSGAQRQTTNNRMELTAVLEGLLLLKRPCAITIVTDSTYICDAFRKGWIDKWQKNGWRTSTKKPVKNREIWEALLVAIAKHTVTWEWVKGHAGHPENERADDLAVAAREALVAGKSLEKSSRASYNKDGSEGDFSTWEMM